METRNRLHCPAVMLVLLMAFLSGCAHRTVQFRFPEQNEPGVTVSDRGKAATIDPALRIIIDRGKLVFTNFTSPFYEGNLRVRIFNRSAEPVVLPRDSTRLNCFHSDINSGRVFYAEPALKQDMIIQPQQEVLLRFERVRCMPENFRLTATYRLQGREHQAEVSMEAYD